MSHHDVALWTRSSLCGDQIGTRNSPDVESNQHCTGRGIPYLDQIGKYVGRCGPHREDFPYLYQIGTPLILPTSRDSRCGPKFNTTVQCSFALSRGFFTLLMVTSRSSSDVIRPVQTG